MAWGRKINQERFYVIILWASYIKLEWEKYHSSSKLNDTKSTAHISTTCRIFSYLFSCYILSGPITYQLRPHSSTDSTSLYSHFITFFTAPHSQHGWDRWVGILTPRTCSGLYYDSKYRENMIGIGRFFMCICIWFSWGACLTDTHLGTRGVLSVIWVPSACTDWILIMGYG